MTLLCCPHCDSTAGVYQEATVRRVWHIGFDGTLIREVRNERARTLHVVKTVRCIACNKGFRWKPPSSQTQR